MISHPAKTRRTDGRLLESKPKIEQCLELPVTHPEQRPAVKQAGRFYGAAITRQLD
jgi:hypothetical protein